MQKGDAHPRGDQEYQRTINSAPLLLNHIWTCGIILAEKIRDSAACWNMWLMHSISNLVKQRGSL